MITLGGITISDNMVLSGVIEASLTIYQQKRTVEGVSRTRITEKIGGRELTLGSDTSGGSNMGMWCSSIIENIKELEKTLTPKVLNYRGVEYLVYIVDTTDFTPLFKWEEEGPTKKYTGTIKLIEA